MSNFKSKVETAVNMVSGPLVGENLLIALKAAMVLEPVFRKMFGNQGERIHLEDPKNVNETSLPAMEFFWQRERVQSANTRQSGTIKANLYLPTLLRGNVTVQRKVANLFQRFLNSDHDLYDQVSGLIMFGKDADYQYDRLLALTGISIPLIEITIPFEFDLKLLRQRHPEINFNDQLDAQEWGWIESYGLALRDEDSSEVLIEGVIFEKQETDG